MAYSWRHFIDDPSKPDYISELPMVKASVKAMDAVTDFVNKTTGNQISKYCVGGLSKVYIFVLLLFAFSYTFPELLKIALLLQIAKFIWS